MSGGAPSQRFRLLEGRVTALERQQIDDVVRYEALVEHIRRMEDQLRALAAAAHATQEKGLAIH